MRINHDQFPSFRQKFCTTLLRWWIAALPLSENETDEDYFRRII